jgi:DNA-binding transcriptional ArsR family regulator
MAINVDLVFGALADPTRRQVIEMLGRRPMRAGELAAAVRLSAPAMSRHLKVLLMAGMVADERRADDARLRVFHVRPEGVASLRAWLDQQQQLWDAQLDAFQRHVEGRGE